MLCLINEIYNGIIIKYNSSHEDMFAYTDVFWPGHHVYPEKNKILFYVSTNVADDYYDRSIMLWFI